MSFTCGRNNVSKEDGEIAISKWLTRGIWPRCVKG
jgi:hypothetical protein